MKRLSCIGCFALLAIIAVIARPANVHAEKQTGITALVKAPAKPQWIPGPPAYATSQGEFMLPLRHERDEGRFMHWQRSLSTEVKSGDVAFRGSKFGLLARRKDQPWEFVDIRPAGWWEPVGVRDGTLWCAHMKSWPQGMFFMRHDCHFDMVKTINVSTMKPNAEVRPISGDTIIVTENGFVTIDGATIRTYDKDWKIAAEGRLAHDLWTWRETPEHVWIWLREEDVRGRAPLQSLIDVDKRTMQIGMAKDGIAAALEKPGEVPESLKNALTQVKRPPSYYWLLGAAGTHAWGIREDGMLLCIADDGTCWEASIDALGVWDKSSLGVWDNSLEFPLAVAVGDSLVISDRKKLYVISATTGEAKKRSVDIEFPAGPGPRLLGPNVSGVDLLGAASQNSVWIWNRSCSVSTLQIIRASETCAIVSFQLHTTGWKPASRHGRC